MSDENLIPNGSKIADQPTSEISALKYREIQAPLIACLIRGYISELGYDKAMEVASAMIRGDAMQTGIRMAEKYGGSTIQVFHRVISEVWAAENALVYSILEETNQKLSFNVTRCRYAELYDRLGLKEFGFCLSCNRDESLIKGFNSRMKLYRTQTIMQGAKLCDFRIVVE
jgi:hypothetical protein